MSSAPPPSSTAGGVVVEPTPAAAHPSTAQIRWSWRYQLWPAAAIASFFTLVGVVGIVVVLVRGPGPAGSTYVTRAGTVAVENGSWFDALVPYLGPAIGGLFVAALVWYGSPRRRIRRFLAHHAWTRWDATVQPRAMFNGKPDSTQVAITLHGTDGRDHELYSEKIYHHDEYGWTDGRQQLYFAGRPDVSGIVVRTLGDTPSMAYQVTQTVEQRREQHRAAQSRAQQQP